MLIYKILLPGQWDAFAAAGHFDGSPDDQRDGFIHCSTREQVPATALRFFAAQPRLVIAALDAGQLGDAVRWERAAGGELFPHVYASAPIDCVRATYQVDGASAVDAALPRD